MTTVEYYAGASKWSLKINGKKRKYCGENLLNRLMVHCKHVKEPNGTIALTYLGTMKELNK